MEKFMREHQIDTLFHFTQASNLPNIFRHGLLPKEILLNDGIETEYNDHFRYDNCENAICMSIEFPNYKMFYSLRQDNVDIDWAVIKVDGAVLLDFDCAFCITNAGSEESYSKSLEERMGKMAFKKLYQDYPGKPNRDEMKIKNWYPTNPQAEVLVFGCVPLTYISEVYFENNAALRQYKSSIPETIKATINTNWFFPREDWRHWQN